MACPKSLYQWVMCQKRYSVLLIPEGSDQVRRLSIKRSYLGGLLALLICLMTGAGWIVGDYLRVLGTQAELTQLRQSTTTQENELQQLSAELTDMRRQMVLLSQNDAKLRTLARLDPPVTEGLTGMGGPYGDEESVDLADIQYQIDRLRAQIDLQRTSQETIHGILNDKHSLAASTPMGVPVKGWTTSAFGYRKDPFTGKRKFHHGYDIAARTGTPIYATADGVVRRIIDQPGYGKTVEIDHGYGYRTRFAHNSRIYVKKGQRVKRYQKIAAVGNTGRSTGPHLHYEVILDGVPVNPKKYF